MIVAGSTFSGIRIFHGCTFFILFLRDWKKKTEQTRGNRNRLEIKFHINQRKILFSDDILHHNSPAVWFLRYFYFILFHFMIFLYIGFYLHRCVMPPGGLLSKGLNLRKVLVLLRLCTDLGTERNNWRVGQ